MRIGFILALILTFAFPLFAQTEKAQAAEKVKVAVIYPDAFEDGKTGIKDLVVVYDKLDEEFKPQVEEVKVKTEQILKMGKEIAAFSVGCRIEYPTKPFMEERINEYKSLTAKFKSRQDELKFLYEKRRLELAKDIYIKIGEAFKQFTKERGNVLILDNRKNENALINNTLIVFDELIDVTKEFISFYNENFSNTKSQ